MRPVCVCVRACRCARITAPSASGAAVYVTVVSEVVDGLIRAYEKRQPVNLTRLKALVSRKHNAPRMPKVWCARIVRLTEVTRPAAGRRRADAQLMDIIAAIPETYRDRLIPYLRAKPVRTASGIAVVVRGVRRVPRRRRHRRHARRRPS